MTLLASCAPANTVVENTAATDLNATEAVDYELPVTEPATVGWATDDIIDPMTDQRHLVARLSVTGASNDIQVEVACRPDQPSISYAISGFDKDGEGSRLDTEINSYNFSPYNRLVYRADQRPAREVVTMKPQYTNQALIAGEAGFDAATAGTLLLRLQFHNSNETYALDQSDGNFRGTVRRCLEARTAAIEEAQELEAARREQMNAPTPQAAEPGPTDVGPAPDGGATPAVINEVES